MSGEYITLADAQIMIGRVPPGSNAFIIDITNLQGYISDTKADQVQVQKAIQDDGSETLVITCFLAGNPVYHMEDGVPYVLEHINNTLAI